ncbi:hypothetical protein [Variovorax boronicumulans]|uniref:hypothetical protein n=1 Tax=Variovorax boronicumulans TaxID=436515 RepID=UPI0033949FB9
MISIAGNLTSSVLLYFDFYSPKTWLACRCYRTSTTRKPKNGKYGTPALEAIKFKFQGRSTLDSTVLQANLVACAAIQSKQYLIR